MTAQAHSNATCFTNFKETRTFGSLDGLRCVSVLAVIWHHASGDMLSWLPSAGRGFLGVDLFFVISGFLIVTLMLREKSATGLISLRNFYGRRTLRIFPVYYGLLVVLSIYFLLSKNSNSAHSFFAELPYHASYTSNFITASSLMAISWSLSAEEQFYLVWPPVEKFLGKLVMPTLGLMLVVNQLINFRVVDPWLHQFFGVGHDDLKILQATFTPICLGVALAHLLHNKRGFGVASKFLSLRSASVLCLLALLAIGNLPSEDISGWQRLTLQLIMTALVASCVAREDHQLRPILTSAPLKRIGSISYGMYLYHVVALFFIQKLLSALNVTSSLALFLFCATATIAIAELSSRYFEQPILMFKRYFYS
jgi:peptidoglycan/LPS O-acetylase OafA/YrhL